MSRNERRLIDWVSCAASQGRVQYSRDVVEDVHGESGAGANIYLSTYEKFNSKKKPDSPFKLKNKFSDALQTTYYEFCYQLDEFSFFLLSSIQFKFD